MAQRHFVTSPSPICPPPEESHVLISGTTILHKRPVPPSPLEGTTDGSHGWLRPGVPTPLWQAQPCALAVPRHCSGAGGSTSGPGPGPASTPSSSDTCCFMLMPGASEQNNYLHSIPNHHLTVATIRKPSGTSRLWSAHTWLSPPTARLRSLHCTHLKSRNCHLQTLDVP